jgi:response regulator RpfG family c-di-GMP phosphodiesterase
MQKRPNLKSAVSRLEKARQAFLGLEIECFIQKPIRIEDLVRRINAELE